MPFSRGDWIGSSGWDYEFVQVPGDDNESTATLMEMLEAGETDLMGGMLYQESMAQRYDYDGSAVHPPKGRALRAADFGHRPFEIHQRHLWPSRGGPGADGYGGDLALRLRSIGFGEERHITVSIGGALAGYPALYDDLYREADRALYRAKETGRDRYWVEDSTEEGEE